MWERPCSLGSIPNRFGAYSTLRNGDSRLRAVAYNVIHMIVSNFKLLTSRRTRHGVRSSRGVLRNLARCAAISLLIGSLATGRASGAGAASDRGATQPPNELTHSRASLAGHSASAAEPVVDTTMLAERALRRFERAVLWKPEEKNAIIDPYLAPLLVFEVPPGAESSPAGAGMSPTPHKPTSPTSDTDVHVDPIPPTIYWISEPIADWPPFHHEDNTNLAGYPNQADAANRSGDADGRHDSTRADSARASATRTTFLVLLPSSADGRAAEHSAADRPSSWIGLVVWSDESNLPRAWEVVSSDGGGGLLFVSQALEDAARREFGPPLPGRTHSLECGLDEAPGVAVVRLLDDSPVPMGPYLYVDAERRVTTVTCRCMASQVGELVSTPRYTVARLNAPRATGGLSAGANVRAPSASRSEQSDPQAANGTNRHETLSTDAASRAANGSGANRPYTEPTAATQDGASLPDRIYREVQRRSTLPRALRWPAHIEEDGKPGDPGEYVTLNPGPDVLPAADAISAYVRRIFEDSKGNHWFGTNGDGVARYDGTSLQYFSTREGFSGDAVRGIVEDKDGNVWFGTDGGVTRYDGRTFTNYSGKNGLADRDVWSIFVDRKGIIWVGTLQGISRFDGKGFTPFPIPESAPDYSRGVTSARIVHSIMEDHEGRMWFGTNGGAYVYDGKSLSNISEKDGLCNNSVNCILEDRHGNIWFATHHNGVCRFDGESFTHVSEKDGVRGTEVWDLFQDREGNIWFPVEGPGLYRYDGVSYTNFGKEQGLESSAIQCTHQDRKGRIWAGGYLGLYRLEGGSFRRISKNGPW